MYRIRTTCLNPACQAVFGIEVAEIGHLEGKTPEIAFGLSKSLHDKESMTYKLTEQTRKLVGLKQDTEATIPKFIECPECHSVFPRSDLTFFVYNATTTQSPH